MPDSDHPKAGRAMCEAAAPQLHDSGTTKIVLFMELDQAGHLVHFRTESPKGLHLEKVKDAAADVKAMHFEPARKNGLPVAVQIRVTFDCAPQSADTPANK